MNGFRMELRFAQFDTFYEVREFLGEHVQTVFFTNFQFMVRGEPANDLEPLEQYFEEGTGLEIHLKALRYDEKAARQHVKRLKDILRTPTILVSQTLPKAAAQEGKDEATMNPEQQQWKQKYDKFFEAVKAETENAEVVNLFESER